MVRKYSAPNFSLVAAIGAIVVSSIILLSSSGGNFFLTSTVDLSAENHVSTHEVSASMLPMDVRQVFNKHDKGGDANGNEQYLKINDDFIDPDNHCEFCARFEYSPGPKGEAALFYESDKVVDITGTKRVVFFAKGENGDETVQFMAAGSGLEGMQTGKESFKNEKSALKTQNVKLGNEWQRYEIDLSKATNLSKVTHAFGFEIYKGQQTTNTETSVFYVKGVLFDTIEAQTPLGLVQQ